MRYFFFLLSLMFVTGITGCAHKSASTSAQASQNAQDIRIFTVPNNDGKITGATIEQAFEAAGFAIDGNNDMNKPHWFFCSSSMPLSR
jgi:hypothetical protein